MKLLSKGLLDMSEEIIGKVKQMIIDALRIEGMEADEIDSDAPLFGEGLGLDSIDALQLVVAMEKEFGVVVPDAATGTKVFASVRAMAAYIAENQK
jgi:acyl carrier protein